MLGLKLRDEFLGTNMPGTTIALRTSDNQGAAQQSAERILEITYPTADVRAALRAIGAGSLGRPIVLMGERGRGKSHIMAVMHHAVQSPEQVESWLGAWSVRLGSPELGSLKLPRGYLPISEPMHNHEYRLLWDPIFDRHPEGQYYRGQSDGQNQAHPSRSLLERMFEKQPVCLILDEFQTWYESLPEREEGTGRPLRPYAFSFVQVLSEIARERPDLLLLAVSVRNNRTDAFQQVHRQGPVVIDFRGPAARQDRQKLLLHRLFLNRSHVAESDVARLTSVYAGERFRLLHADLPASEQERIQKETSACWPFSPELLDLLEDHILLSSAAQETRDLIRILAQVFKSRGEQVPLVTPADFFVDGCTDEVQTLVDSISVQNDEEKLRQIAQRDLEAVLASGASVPHARELVSAIWMRSMSPGRLIGGTPAELHLDATRDQAVDDNAFQAELARLTDCSVNIHGSERLWFGISENPRAKVRACAMNGKLWQADAVPSAGQAVYPGLDVRHLRATLRHLLVSDSGSASRVVVLGPNWRTTPWEEVDEAERPARWEGLVLLVVPDQIEGGEAGRNATLGAWLAEHVPRRRNAVRFFLQGPDAPGLFQDEELIYAARRSYLCSKSAWGRDDKTYASLQQEFDRPLRDSLKSRFCLLAVLRRWDFRQPDRCRFDYERITAQGFAVPAAVEEKIAANLFDPGEFAEFVLERAREMATVGAVLEELVEPPPPNVGEAMPFLGVDKHYEQMLAIAAQGRMVLNVGNAWVCRQPEESVDEALRRIRQKAFSGLSQQDRLKVFLALPGAVGGGGVATPDACTEDSRGATASLDPGCPHGSLLQPSVPAWRAEAREPSGGILAKVAQRTRRRTAQPATAVNLSGCFESWGVRPDQQIESVQMEFFDLTVQQVRQILQRLPSGLKASLEIAYDDQGGDSHGC